MITANVMYCAHFTFLLHKDLASDIRCLDNKDSNSETNLTEVNMIVPKGKNEYNKFDMKEKL